RNPALAWAALREERDHRRRLTRAARVRAPRARRAPDADRRGVRRRERTHRPLPRLSRLTVTPMPMSRAEDGPRDRATRAAPIPVREAHPEREWRAPLGGKAGPRL